MDPVAEDRVAREEVPLRILVVDDDALNQRLMQVVLGRQGYQVDVASDGEEAFAAVQKQKYDIVFMDLQMPVMDGIEASRRIREWENGSHHTFIVALTASYLPQHGPLLFQAGIDNYISKPFELDHINRLIQYSLANRNLESDPAEVARSGRSDQVLDVQKGIQRVGGDPDAYKELLGEFIGELPERLLALEHAFVKQDLAALSRAAHNLNGIAANLGALQLSEYAHRIDKESNGGYTESIQDLLREMKSIGGKLLETSNNFLADRQINAGSS